MLFGCFLGPFTESGMCENGHTNRSQTMELFLKGIITKDEARSEIVLVEHGVGNF